MSRFTPEEKAFIAESSRRYYLSKDRPEKGETYQAMRNDLHKENEDRRSRGIPVLRDPSFDTFSRILTASLPADLLQGRARKV